MHEKAIEIFFGAVLAPFEVASPAPALQKPENCMALSFSSGFHYAVLCCVVLPPFGLSLCVHYCPEALADEIFCCSHAVLSFQSIALIQELNFFLSFPFRHAIFLRLSGGTVIQFQESFRAKNLNCFKQQHLVARDSTTLRVLRSNSSQLSIIYGNGRLLGRFQFTESAKISS